MVELGRVSRPGFYRFLADRPVVTDDDMDLRDAIQRIALEWPSYGRPRITAELRRQDWVVNPKRVYRLMREDNLLCVRKRKFVVTTDSNHGRKIYPNLARDMVVTGVDQLWVADLTDVVALAPDGASTSDITGAGPATRVYGPGAEFPNAVTRCLVGITVSETASGRQDRLSVTDRCARLVLELTRMP